MYEIKTYPNHQFGDFCRVEIVKEKCSDSFVILKNFEKNFELKNITLQEKH